MAAIRRLLDYPDPTPGPLQMPNRSPTAKTSATQAQLQSVATAVLVLGMHRSGTSAVARMLNLRGADLGGELLPPKQDNERGFWENRALLALHEQFLAQMGLHWYDLASLPEDWRSGGAARWFVGALPEVLTQQFGDSALFLVKDPRLSLLAPLWIEVLESRAVRPVFVITVRHPDEVAASLAARDGFAPARSHLLWLQNLLEAERATRGHPRVFVSYERVIADWRAELARITGALHVSWPTQGADVDRQIDAFIAPSLRHHRSDLRTSDPAAMPETVQQAYRVASAAGRDEASATTGAFDDLAAAFDAALNLGGPMIADLSSQLTREREQHAQEVERARATIDGFATEIAQAREAHQSRDRIESELRDALAARAEEIERARANIDALAGELDQAREGFAAKDREIAAARDNINALTTEMARAAEIVALKDREIATARRSVDDLIDELGQARAVIASKEREIDDARQHVAAIAADLDRARASIGAKDTELDAARANIGVLAGQIDRAREGFAAKDAELDAARMNIDALVAEIGRAREAHAARDATETALRDELTALRGELTTLRNSRWFRLARALRLIDRDRQ